MDNNDKDLEKLSELYDRLYKRIIANSDNHPDKPPFPLEPFPDEKIGAILVQGLGSCSNPEDKDNFHLRKIVNLLGELKIPYLIFSYKGPKDLNYIPRDTLVGFASTAKHLSHFVAAFPYGDIFIFAHSQGGNLTAHWACNYANSAELNRLAGVFFLSSPVLLPRLPVFKPEDSKEAKYKVSLKPALNYAVGISELSSKLKQKYVVIRCWRDTLAPSKFSSFLLDTNRSTSPLSETIISDKASHLDVCNHHVTVNIIRTYIQRLPSALNTESNN